MQATWTSKRQRSGRRWRSDQVRPTLDESELSNYWEREKLYGEVYAMQWLQSKHRSQ